MGRQERTKKDSAKSCAIIARWARPHLKPKSVRDSRRDTVPADHQPMQLLLLLVTLLPPRDDLPEMPPRDVIMTCPCIE